jgi:hypothetical protein
MIRVYLQHYLIVFPSVMYHSVGMLVVKDTWMHMVRTSDLMIGRSLLPIKGNYSAIELTSIMK